MSRSLLAWGAAMLAAATVLTGAGVSADAGSRPPRVEVAFVLDTTGSMGGLLAGAKAKIWAIANQIAAGKPTPELRMGLVAYRDRGDEYVTRVFDLSADIDAIYGRLAALEAGGGGDSPESVNQALREAVHGLSWSTGPGVLRVVFLVGDQPPHMDYDEVGYPETCRSAVGKDIIINTIQCGSDPSTTPVWRDIAARAEGRYAAVGQDGDVDVVATPVDEELAALNVELNRTVVPYGRDAVRREVAAKQALADAAPPSTAAERLAYNAREDKVIGGEGDLVVALASGAVSLESLERDALPDDLRGLSSERLGAELERRAARRRELQSRAAELLRRRRAYLTAEAKRLAEAGTGSAFDTEVAAMLRAAARRKGIAYDIGDETAGSVKGSR